MQQRKTLTLRLSAAVLAGGLLFTGMGPAAAATVAQATQASTAQQRTQAYDTLKKLADAGTVGEAKDIASSDAPGAVPGLERAAASLDGLADSAPLVAAETHGLDTVVDVRDLVIKAALHAVDPQRAAEDPEAACAETDLDRFSKTLLPSIQPGATPEEMQQALQEIFAIVFLSGLGGLDAPAYEALFEGPTKRLSVFGEEQNKTKAITQDFKDVKKFWAGDVDPGKITLGAMKDDIVTNKGKLQVRKYGAYALASQDAEGVFDPRKALESTNPEVIEKLDSWGKALHGLIDLAPILDDGESPLFTTNAYAYSPTPGAEAEAGLPKRLVFGDGMLQFLRFAKYNETAITSIIGHEFGHHIQYVNGFDQPEGTTPEKTRHSELEADAYGNYFVAHKKGGNFKAADKALSVKLAFNIGDCDATADGHHGTPVQRQASALWAQGLAESQKKNGHVFSAESIRIKFNKALPELLAAK
ncbi:M48 family metalloprotease [Galactobacter valiniphilus]|uniref:hypothetical protein n=1 Tax=Galactobacter valiniphilus TaxID=2676122 RepID=UPI0037370D58